VASPNAMTLLTAASRGPRNGRYGRSGQLAGLRLSLPPVQQVSRSAYAAAGSGSPAALTLLAGRSGQARAQALGPWRTRPRYERPD
jgi:hypothetical protein